MGSSLNFTASLINHTACKVGPRRNSIWARKKVSPIISERERKRKRSVFLNKKILQPLIYGTKICQQLRRRIGTFSIYFVSCLQIQMLPKHQVIVLISNKCLFVLAMGFVFSFSIIEKATFQPRKSVCQKTPLALFFDILFGVTFTV